MKRVLEKETGKTLSNVIIAQKLKVAALMLYTGEPECNFQGFGNRAGGERKVQ